ncbi:SCA7-domain-containing protein [Dendrothele bispora CBS 962.96]|uniref:SCA7-domain-containing protein n=1 Tax=Dendrothele bispora (strain CBS 962.96) TaxID=1314807 RepID=A0A4S8MAD5_DENBC|nr:SCA7-domain-containing protein [Dendrothele bispora CBS 962.96]
MKLFGAQPLTSTSDIGIVRCRDCEKPILRSAITEHLVTCAQIRNGGKSGKAKVDEGAKAGKKRKASPTPSDLSQPQKKKAKPAPKVNKGRVKGPVDYDRQCGVINDKGLPCSRSLTCKSHSMGAKRAVLGRSRKYDDLLLDWQREHNPNFVEPVKKETKAEKKEKREKEKLEKKRLAEENAAAMGLDLNKKSSGVNLSKKSGKKAAAAAAAIRMAESMGEAVDENLDDLDSDVEVDTLTQAVRSAREKGVIAQPLAVPCDAGSWFVQRRERARCCRDLLVGALGGASSVSGLSNMTIVNRNGGLGAGLAAGRLA